MLESYPIFPSMSIWFLHFFSLIVKRDAHCGNGTPTGAEQQDGQHAGYGEETVAEQGVSLCETFLFGIKNVFAKFDKRLG